MDTRNKIIPAEAAADAAQRLRAQGKKITIITGSFDVVLAAHARDLGEAEHAVMVILSPISGALLAESARAELVAALNMVDYVVVGGEDAKGLALRLPADQVISREAADAEERRRLIEHVQRRHSQ